MKCYLISTIMLICVLARSQEKTTISVIVPNEDDEVYIVGNQADLGDWKPDKIKMFKVSEYVRMIAIPLYFPAEFMFTKGSWETEGIIQSLDYNPNIYLEEYVKEKTYRIKGWKNELLKAKYLTEYKFEPFDSEILRKKQYLKIFLPSDYSFEKTYPVIYLPFANDQDFEIASTLLKLRIQQDYQTIPDCILVGIPLENFKQEFFENQEQENGFINYLIFDLVPYIESNYSTSGFKILINQDEVSRFNQAIILNDLNPFQAFVSLNPSDNQKLFYNSKDFYDVAINDDIFYYVAHSSFQLTKDELNKLNNKPARKTRFKSEIYNIPKDNLFMEAFQDALGFVFSSYKNLNIYKDFDEFLYKYERNVVDTYKMPATYYKEDIDYFLRDIIERNDVEMYSKLVDFLKNNEVLDSDIKYTFNDIDTAKHYYLMERYEQSKNMWEQILENFDPLNLDNQYAQKFFNHIEIILKCFEQNEMHYQAIDFLYKTKDKLAPYILESYYFMAKYASKHDVEEVRGLNALKFCYDNYTENKFFNKDDLDLIQF